MTPTTLAIDEAPLDLIISGEEPRQPGKKRIFVMSPRHHSSHTGGWRQCYNALVEADLPGYQFITASISGCGVAKARNVMMAHAVSLGCDAVLCWDSDIGLPGKTKEEWLACIERLLGHDEKLGNIAGLYAAKTEENPRWILTPMMGERRRQDGLLKVYEAGTGLKLIWMWQIQAIIKAHEEIAYTPDDSPQRQTMWDLFSMGVVNGRYLSEDYYFDYRLRQMGYDIWVDTKILTRHRGEAADGRSVDFPTTPIPLPGFPYQTPPDAAGLPRYMLENPFTGVLGQPDLQGWNSTAEIFTELLSQINPSVIIEVGTWKGASAIHMAMNSEATIYCCDTWLGGIDHALGETDYDQTPRHDRSWVWDTFRTNVALAGLSDRIIPIPQTSINAARWLAANKVTAPMIYVDASHEYTDVCQDLCAYWSLLTPGGVMFGDDYHDQNNSGVAKAVQWFGKRIRQEVHVTPSGHWNFLKPV